MRPLMKRPIFEGLGRRNDTVESIKTARALEQAAAEVEALARRARPQAAPMSSLARMRVYTAQTGGRITPAMGRRGLKKERQHGPYITATALDESRVSSIPTATEVREDELPAWDPEQCACHINPPCGYCEGGEYQL